MATIYNIKKMVISRSYACGYDLDKKQPSYMNISRIEAMKAEAVGLTEEGKSTIDQQVEIDFWIGKLERKFIALEA